MLHRLGTASQPVLPLSSLRPWNALFACCKQAIILICWSGLDRTFFGRYGPRRLRLQLSVPTKLIEPTCLDRTSSRSFRPKGKCNCRTSAEQFEIRVLLRKNAKKQMETDFDAQTNSIGVAISSMSTMSWLAQMQSRLFWIITVESSGTAARRLDKKSLANG